MSNKIISIDTLRYYNDKVSNYVDEKVSDTVDNLGLDELNAVLVDTDAEAETMSRKIKDIKDKHTGELIYPRTHVSAVVLSSDSTLEDLVEVKQDKINDLDDIRTGAAKGATALQSVPSEYVTETELSNKGYATISALNNKVDAINGKQLSTEDFTTALKNKLEGLSNYDDTELSDAIETLRGDFDNIVSGDTTTAIKTFNEVIAFLDGLTDTQDLESIIASIEQQIAGKMDKVTLSKVATSGNYNDLSNKPTIPAAVTESTVSGWGFTKNTGTYSKPSGGIPKSDLASAVQTSLGKADTALQSYTEQYKGTVTGVKVNGSTKSPSSGTVDIGNVVTSVKINGSTKSPSSGVVDLGTVITSHQDISGKQDKLVSGTNIKTINGTSILGSGNIKISGGGGEYLPLTGGTITGDLDLIGGTGGAGNFTAFYVTSAEVFSNIYHLSGYGSSGGDHAVKMGDNKVEIINEVEQTKASIDWSGNGTKFLSDDGTYKTINSGSSDANVQAVDTGDVLDDVTVNYATKTYVDGLVGDINSVLESIINV